MSALVSDGDYHAIGYDSLDNSLVGIPRSVRRAYERDRLLHFFDTDRYTETGTYDNLGETVLVLRYADIIQIRAFKQVKNIHKEIKPGLLVLFRNGAHLLVTLDTEEEVQDLVRFLRYNSERCKKAAEKEQ